MTFHIPKKPIQTLRHSFDAFKKGGKNNGKTNPTEEDAKKPLGSVPEDSKHTPLHDKKEWEERLAREDSVTSSHLSEPMDEGMLRIDSWCDMTLDQLPGTPLDDILTHRSPEERRRSMD